MTIKKLNIGNCYSIAWKSFAKWWIPICLISAVIFVFQIIPQILVNSDVQGFKTTAKNAVIAFQKQDIDELEEISFKLQAQTTVLIRKFAVFGLYTFPFIALFTVILLMYANWAVKNRQEKRKPLSTLIYIAVVHMFLAFGKMFTFCIFFPLGIYIYVKLLFVSLIMLEGKKGALEAISMSWKMTEGNFWILFLLVVINLGIQLISVPTVIGIIPATGFVNTARASAFRILWEESPNLS